MPSGRAEVPHDRVVALWKQAEAHVLVNRPHPDVGRRDVADVAHVEAGKRPQLGAREPGLRPGETLAPHPVEVGALLPVDLHRAVRPDSHQATVPVFTPAIEARTSNNTAKSRPPSPIAFAAVNNSFVAAV